ncbi:hypothetical protein ABTK02_20420, partial [Acinetobacter baumannii]
MASDLFLLIESFLISMALPFCNHGGRLCFCCSRSDPPSVEGAVNDLLPCPCLSLEEERAALPAL